MTDSTSMRDKPLARTHRGHVRVVLVEPEKEGNMGSIARSMRNFGMADLYLVSPKVPIGDEAYRYATRGKEILEQARIVQSLSDALSGVDRVIGTTAIVGTSSRNVLRVPIDPAQLASRLLGTTGSVALLFGRESTGLTNSELEQCDLIVSIPASEEYNVLNVATAASIMFYELHKVMQKSQNLLEPSQHSLEHLMSIFNQLADIADLPLHRKRLANRAFRSVLAKSVVSRREVSLITGVLRRIRDKAQLISSEMRR